MSAFERFADRLDDWVGVAERAAGFAASFSIGLFALGIAADAILRIAGFAGISWLGEIIEYALFVGVFAAAPWVLREAAHVRMDIVLSNLSQRAAIWLESALSLMGAAVSAVLAYYGTAAAIKAFVENDRQFKTVTVYTWWLLAIFGLSMLLLAVEFVLRLRRVRKSLAERAANAGSGTGF